MTEPFNAAAYLTERRVAAGDADRVALRHPGGTHTYGQLTEDVRRVAGGLAAIGVRPEERVLLCMADDIELATGILATIYLGAVAVPCSTMLTGGELGKLVVDSRARVLLGSHQFAAAVTTAAAGAPDLRHVVLTGDTAPVVAGDRPASPGRRCATPSRWPRPTRPGPSRPRSGSTPRAPPAPPRAPCTATSTSATSARPTPTRCSASAATTSASRPPSCSSPTASATACCSRCRWAPARCWSRRGPTPRSSPTGSVEHGVTLFFGGPSFWGPLMAAGLPRETFATVRNGVSAGEALPARMFHGVQRPVRLRDPRRHRLHRGAAHLHLQRRGQGRARQLGLPRARLPRRAAPRRRLGDRGQRRAGDAVGGGRVALHGLLVSHRHQPPGVPRRVDAHRRHLRARRRRQLDAASAAPTTC